jgi:hypothetical protein
MWAISYILLAFITFKFCLCYTEILAQLPSMVPAPSVDLCKISRTLEIGVRSSDFVDLLTSRFGAQLVFALRRTDEVGQGGGENASKSWV